MSRARSFSDLLADAGLHARRDEVAAPEPSSQPDDRSPDQSPPVQPYRYLRVAQDGSLHLRDDARVDRLLARIESWPIGFGFFPHWRTLTPYVWRSVDARRGRRVSKFDARELVDERAAAFERARRSKP